MLYLTYKMLGITTSQHTGGWGCAWSQAHMHVCVRVYISSRACVCVCVKLEQVCSKPTIMF